MHSLYSNQQIHAFVSLPHGEGFGLPLFEAAYQGLPVVATGWSGQLDFLVDSNGRNQFYNVAFDLQQVQKEVVWDGVIVPDSMWAYAREGSAKEQMRFCYEHIEEEIKLCTGLAERFSAEKMYEQFVSHVYEDKISNISMSQIPKISLITSVFNAKEFVDQFIEDVTRQTIFESHCEWVILNVNKQGDDYEEKAFLELKKKFPNNIVYKRLDEDPGIYAVWNQAIEMSSGDFLTNVNCDDRRSPIAFEIQAKNLVAYGDADLIYNDSYVVREPNILFENVQKKSERYNFENFSKEAMLRSNLPHNNPMWRKSLHETFGFFNEKYKSAGDWEMWLRAAFGGAKFKKCSNILGVYYMNPVGISTNPENSSWKREEEKEIFTKYLEFLNNG